MAAYLFILIYSCTYTYPIIGSRKRGEDVLVRFIEGYDQLVEGPLYSKYAFLGALRSAAQMVPYEVSIGLILIECAL
jgi:hypothetical protein